MYYCFFFFNYLWWIFVTELLMPYYVTSRLSVSVINVEGEGEWHLIFVDCNCTEVACRFRGAGH